MLARSRSRVIYLDEKIDHRGMRHDERSTNQADGDSRLKDKLLVQEGSVRRG